MVNEIVAAAAGGFLAWLVIESAQYFVLRQRLTSYLVIQVNRKLWTIKQNCDWIREIEKTNVHDGFIIKGWAQFTSDGIAELTDTRELMLRYLSRNDIEKMTKFTSVLWESECLVSGFCGDLEDYAKKKVPLKSGDCDFLSAKVRRIVKISDILPTRIRQLEELPTDYAGILGPTSVLVPPQRPDSQGRDLSNPADQAVE